MNSELAPLLVDKPLGVTPLEALNVLRLQLGLPEDMKLAYAGRLDPMASGLLVVLHGELLKNQEKFWHLTKIYEASIVLGVGSDSYDTLGIAKLSGANTLDEQQILAAAQSLVGKTLLSVPIYSSYCHEGRPLFQWARENKPIPAPVRRMAVSELEVRGIERLTLAQVARTAIERCALVTGDFRQKEISARWQALAQENGSLVLSVVHLTIACDAGTYIRSLAHELGRRLKTAGLLFDLRRTVVGPFRLDSPAVARISWPR